MFTSFLEAGGRLGPRVGPGLSAQDPGRGTHPLGFPDLLSEEYS